MLSLSKIELNYFFSEDTKEALKHQTTYYLKAKYNKSLIQCQEVAEKHIDETAEKLEYLLQRRRVSEAKNLIKDDIIFSDMLKSFQNDELVSKFNNHIIKRINTRKQAFGYFNILLDNQITSKTDFKCDRIYDELFKFDENNVVKSQVKLKNAMRRDLNKDFNPVSDAINESKKKNEYVDAIATFAMKILEFFETDFERYVKDKLEFIKDFANFIFEITMYTAKNVVKPVVKLYKEVEQVAELELEVRRELNKEKRKNLKKLKYKMI